MSEVVWVALVSAGAAVTTALVTQYLSMSAAKRQADRSDTREALQWRRTEASRLHEQQTKNGREFWAFALMSYSCMLVRVTGDSRAVAQNGRSPSDLAGEAYAVALFGLPEIANLAKAYYHATIDLERHIEGQQDLSALGCIPVWRSAFQRLEDTTAALQNGDLAEK